MIKILQTECYPSSGINQDLTPDLTPLDHTDNNILELLFPERQSTYKTKDKQVIQLLLDKKDIFGPDPALVMELLYDSLTDMIVHIKNNMSIKELQVVTTSSIEINMNGVEIFNHAPSQHPAPVALDAFDFFRLYHLLKTRKNYNNMIVTLMFRPDAQFSAIVPVNTTIQQFIDLCSKSYPELTMNQTDYLIHFPSGINIEGEEMVNPALKTLCLPNSNLTLDQESKGLFSFPYFNRKLTIQSSTEQSISACQNCLNCSDYCPSEILPNHIYHNVIKGNLDETEHLQIDRCILCGNCSVVCPSNLPLAKIIYQAMQTEDEEEEENEGDA